MNLIHTTEVTVAEGRHRKLFDEAAMTELADSIHRRGLIHPPVARKTSDGKLILVAGERRFRAIKRLHESGLTVSYLGNVVPAGYLPLAFFDELDPDEAKEIELDENTKRKDLTWQELALATAELHKIRSAKDPNWNLTRTAEEMNERRGTVSTDASQVHNRIILSEHLDKHEVASAKSEKEAMKILTRQLEVEFQQAIGTAVSTAEKRGHVLRLGGAIEEMATIPPGVVDVMLTDPPYGVGATGFDSDSSMGTTIKHTYSDNWTDVKELLNKLALYSFKVAKEKAHSYIFCDVTHFMELRALMEAAGWRVWTHPLIWVKDVGFIPDTQHGPRRMYECILYAIKGDKPVNALYNDVIICPAHKDKEHAAQKPVELYVNLLTRSVLPGDLVLDPFCGSGTIFEAADKMQCRAVGFDNDPASVAVAEGRLAKL